MKIKNTEEKNKNIYPNPINHEHVINNGIPYLVVCDQQGKEIRREIEWDKMNVDYKKLRGL